VDRAAISRLAASLGEQGNGSVAKLIETFLGHVPDQVAALRRALERSEVDEVRREAHTLKANAATFGADSLADLCRELESEAESGTLGRAKDLLPRIEARLERVTGELERIHVDLRR
jgi:HPt (histidine-containing phosphotransfer) domain-containing protein